MRELSNKKFKRHYRECFLKKVFKIGNHRNKFGRGDYSFKDRHREKLKEPNYITILLNIDKIKAVIDNDTYCFIYEKEAKASFFRTTISRMNENFLKLRKITLSLIPPKVTIEKRKNGS